MSYQAHHGPLSNTYVLISIFGMIFSAAIWKFMPSWGFLILLFSIITFIASFISAVRAPLMSDEEIETAIHEKYHGRRYPDTDLHHGHIPKNKKYLHSKHKKKLVELHLGTPKKKTTKRVAKKAVKKAVKKKTTTRKPAKKPTKKTITKKKRTSKKKR